ncbi:TonB-dependent receptor [Occallatibacter savannae]|uniref:TonB-dependent receptor n=1 Tax=Occallatibacter savannae TaxID=1002691 RepID=UPI000D686C96|nr:TonB-dependent receptor [Occallatibacter savannae]
MTRRWTTHILNLAFVMLLLAAQPTAYAQFNSSLEGVISDQTGAVMPDARVVLRDVATNITRVGTTNASGYFRFNGLGPGSYEIAVEANGFAKKVVAAQVAQDQATNVNVKLFLASQTSMVTVSAEQTALNTDETRLAATLASEQISNLPLQNGDVLSVVRVAPGVTGIDEDRNLWSINIGSTGMNAQANGRPSGSNSYELDGVSIESNSKGTGTQIEFVPQPDMLQEVSMEVNNYSVDYGASSSMKINMTTKGGSNDFHGSLGTRYSGRGLNSTGFNTTPSLPFSRRWYMGTIGGPIVKNRTFFFFSYLHQTQITAISGLVHYATNEFVGGPNSWAAQTYPNSVNVQKLLIPFPAGDSTISGQKAALQKTGVVQHASDQFQQSPGVCAVPERSGPWFFGHNTGVFHPIDCGMEIVDTGVLNQSPRVNGFQLNGRLDQYFRNGNDRVYAAYLLQPQTSDFIWWRPGFNSTTPGGTRYLNFNYTHIFTPSLLNQAAFSYMRVYSAFNGSPANTIPFLSLMLGTGNDATDYFGTPGSPTNNHEHDFQMRDDVTWNRGRHNLKFGFNTKHLNYYENQAGWISKPEVPIYWNWSDMFDGHPSGYNLSTLGGLDGKFLPNIYGDKATQFGFYVQDDWKVSPKLLLTMGLRWDDYGNPAPLGSEVLPFYNMVRPSGVSLRDAIVNNQLSTRKMSTSWLGRENKNILPRVGFAYSPNPALKLTIHGGIGLYEDALNLQGVQGGIINSPNYLNLSFSMFASSAPLNVIDVRNLYGTDWKAPAPFGRTYQYPAITPNGVDAHGEVYQDAAHTSVIRTNLQGQDLNLSPQKTMLYNLQAEKELNWNVIVGLGYSGSYSWDQFGSGNYNAFPGDEIQHGGKYTYLSQEWNDIGYRKNIWTSNYNALLVTARQNHGKLSWQGSFTWSKNLGYGGLVPDIYDPFHYYGPVSGSVPVGANGSAQYEFPGRTLKNPLERAILGGWEISGLFTAQSGTPLSLITTANFNPSAGADPGQGGDYLGNNNPNALVDIASGVKKKGYSRTEFRKGMFCDKFGYCSNSLPKTNTLAFNPTGYGTQPVYGGKNQGYNSFYGPGYLAVDSGLHKKVILPWLRNENSSTLTLGIEGTNILNRVNLSAPASTDFKNTSSFGLGVSQAANQARVFQVMGKFEF